MDTKKLSLEQICFYRERGYVSPIRAIDKRRALELASVVEAARPDLLKKKKLHLTLSWVNDLMREPPILDAIEDILGPNIMVWNTALFVKRSKDASFVSWHQDATYWGLQPPDVITAWVALSPSTRENGALRVIAGSHLKQQMPHRDTYDPNNLLSRGQEIMVQVDESAAAMCELSPGEMSLHHILTVHGSDPNPSDSVRIGLAIRYVAPHVRQTAGESDAATLVRGSDGFRHFIHEQSFEGNVSIAEVLPG